MAAVSLVNVVVAAGTISFGPTSGGCSASASAAAVGVVGEFGATSPS